MGFKIMFLDCRRGLHPARKVLCANHISHRAYWHHFGKPTPRDIILCSLLAVVGLLATQAAVRMVAGVVGLVVVSSAAL